MTRLIIAALSLLIFTGDAYAGPLSRLRGTRGGGYGGEDVCTDGSCGPGQGNIRIGPNESIVGDVPQHLWPVQQPSVAVTTISEAAPVADIETAVEVADEVELIALTKQMSALSERIQRLQVQTTERRPIIEDDDNERTRRLEAQVAAIAKHLNVQVEEPASTANELLDRLPRLRLETVNADGEVTDTAEIKFKDQILQQLNENE